MKRFRAIVAMACVLALAASAYAGSWRFSGRFGGGRRVSRRGRGRGAYLPRHTKLGSPWGRPQHGYPWWTHPGTQVHFPGNHWTFTWHGGHSVGYGWGWGSPYGWAAQPTIYYRTVGYRDVVPVVSSVTVVSERDSRGVFMVPVTAPPRPLTPESMPEPSPIRVLKSPARGDLARIGAIFRRGDLTGTETRLKKLLFKHPSDAQVHCVYAYVLFLREKYTAASFVLRRALTLDGRLVAAGRMVLAGFYNGEEIARGLAKLDAHIGEDPTNPTPLLLRAYLHFLAGARDAACTDLDVILEANKNDAPAALLRQYCAPRFGPPR